MARRPEPDGAARANGAPGSQTLARGLAALQLVAVFAGRG